MVVLVTADHDNKTLAQPTYSVVTAAKQLADEVHVLVAGNAATEVAEQASKMIGVSKVLHCDSPQYEHGLVEAMAPLIVDLAKSYEAILGSTSTFSKGLMPRVAALLDLAPISDISAPFIQFNNSIRSIPDRRYIDTYNGLKALYNAIVDRLRGIDSEDPFQLRKNLL